MQISFEPKGVPKQHWNDNFFQNNTNFRLPFTIDVSVSAICTAMGSRLHASYSIVFHQWEPVYFSQLTTK